MTVSLHFFGHSAFAVKIDGRTVLIDPFLSDNPLCSTPADEISADLILLTHGHADHVGDTVALAKRTGATVAANFEIVNWLQQQGLTNCHPMHIGGSHDFGFVRVKLTIAHHGSSLPDGSCGGSPAGLLLMTPSGTIYHAGDTGLFLDMQLLGEEQISTAILPIGDNFTMGPEDSVKAVRMLNPKTVIPCHYNTWPVIEQDAEAWAARVREDTKADPVVLKPGDSYAVQ